ncbi:hypothetical protein FOA52_008008 [Chlamydomonas sp. UWO 241]|nr:hypothetical protein FOA52_008008 [Chlamydomonas sp. UWO 241]
MGSATLMTVVAACMLSSAAAVSGWLDISVQVWDEIRQEGNSKVWERSTYYDGSSSRAYIENRDLSNSRFTIPKNPANTKPLPALGDAIRSMRLNVTCEPPVVGGTCEMIMLGVSVQLYSFPLSKDRGGGAVGFNISYCDPNLCAASCSGNECVVSWSSLPGMDNTASALAILTNYPEFDQGISLTFPDKELSYQCVGCYRDYPTIWQQQNPTDHLVPYRLFDEPSGSLTTDKCAALAKAGGYNFFATQWGNQCWGGFGDYRQAIILSVTQSSPASCTLLCSGRFSEVCGECS